MDGESGNRVSRHARSTPHVALAPRGRRGQREAGGERPGEYAGNLSGGEAPRICQQHSDSEENQQAREEQRRQKTKKQSESTISYLQRTAHGETQPLMPEQVEETIVDIEKIAQSGQRPTADPA